MNAIKVDQDVAYAANVSEAYCKHLFKSVSSVLDDTYVLSPLFFIVYVGTCYPLRSARWD
jgi:hypothetical protein